MGIEETWFAISARQKSLKKDKGTDMFRQVSLLNIDTEFSGLKAITPISSPGTVFTVGQ